MSPGAGEDPRNRVYTLPELAAITGIDYRTLHNWQKRGTLRASRQAATGSGTVSLFDETDAVQVLILAELRRSGVEMRLIEAVAERVWELARTMSGEEVLVISEGSVSLTADEELGDRLAGDGPSVVLRIGGVRRALDAVPRAA